MSIAVSQVNLGLSDRFPTLPMEVEVVPNVKDDVVVDSEDKLKAVFIALENTLASLPISSEIYFPGQGGIGLNEFECYIVFKKRVSGKNIYYLTDAAIFHVELDTKAKYRLIKFGFGTQGEEGHVISQSLGRDDGSGFPTVGTIRANFRKFLNDAMPKLLEWDREHAENEFWSADKNRGELPRWWAQRAVASLAHGGVTELEVDGQKIGIGELQEFADAKMVKAVRLGPDKFELVSA